MKISVWKCVVLKWVNALNLVDISDLDDLTSLSDFLLTLLENIKEERLVEPNKDYWDIINEIVQDEYPKFEKTCKQNESEVVLVTSLCLVWASLDVASLRTPLYSLTNDDQVNIQSFLQSLLTVDRKSVTHHIVMEAILDINGPESNECSTPVSSSKTADFSFIVPASSFKNKMKFLSKQVDQVTNENQQLQDELDITRLENKRLKLQLEKRCLEIQKLKNDVSDLNGKLETKEDDEELRNVKMKVSSLQRDVSQTEKKLVELSQELDSANNAVHSLTIKLKEEESEKNSWKEKAIQCESSVQNLTHHVKTLELEKAAMKSVLQEQAEIDVYQSSEIDVKRDVSCNLSFYIPESLDAVIDVRLSELQLEYDSLKTKYEASAQTVEEQTERISWLENEVSEYKTRISTLDNLPRVDTGELIWDISNLRAVVEDKNYIIEKLEKENALLQSHLISNNIEIDSLVREIRELQESEDKEKVSHLTTLTKKLNLELGELYRKFEAATVKPRESCQSNGDQMRNELRNKAHEISVLKGTISDKSDECLKLSAEVSILKESVIEKEEMIENLKKSVDSLNKNLGEADHTKCNCEEELNFLRGTYLQTIEELDMRNRELLQCKEDVLDIYRSWAKEKLLEAESGELMTLSQLLNTIKRDMSSVAKVSCDTKSPEYECIEEKCVEDQEIETLKSALEEKELEIISLNETIKKINSKVEHLESQLQNKPSIQEESSNDDQISQLQSEIEGLKRQNEISHSEVTQLKLDIQMCAHEKSVLEKRVQALVKEAEHLESAYTEIKNLKELKDGLESQLSAVSKELKKVYEQIELEEQLNNAFDAKLVSLQTKMKCQFDKEMAEAVEEYTQKINYLKEKILRNQQYIEQLSLDLWGTSDRYLVTQQECATLRSQLLKTQRELDFVNSQFTSSQPTSFDGLPPLTLPQHPKGERLEVFEELRRLSSHMKQSLKGHSRYSLMSGRVVPLDSESEEEFNDHFLADLKAGICRTIDGIQRFSCPPTQIKCEDKEVEQLLPTDKPKKQKGQISYKKPGPPTPCRNSTRYSLQENGKVELKKGLREKNGTSGHQEQSTSKFRNFFSSRNKENKEASSPKHKRRSFFGRKLGNRENVVE